MHIELDIEEGRLKQIKWENSYDAKACFREMLRIWLMRDSYPPSWLELADALETLGSEDIASQIRDKYSGKYC